MYFSISMRPTAQGAYRIMAVLRYVDHRPGLPRPTVLAGTALSISTPSASLRCMYCSPPRRGARGEDDARGVYFRWCVQPCPTGPIFARTAIIRYPAQAVGLKPLARQGEACLRGRERNNYSKTISPRLGEAKPACAGYTGFNSLRII